MNPFRCLFRFHKDAEINVGIFECERCKRLRFDPPLPKPERLPAMGSLEYKAYSKQKPADESDIMLPAILLSSSAPYNPPSHSMLASEGTFSGAGGESGGAGASGSWDSGNDSSNDSSSFSGSDSGGDSGSSSGSD
jgi:uncharacterized membrane protein YgcG